MDKKLNIFNNKFLILLILMPFFEPEYISSELYNIHNMFIYWRMLSSIFIIFIYLRDLKISKIILTIIVYQGIILGATCLNKYGYMTKALNTSLYIVSVCMFIELGLKSKCKNMIYSLLLLFEVLVYCNFITLIVYPDGMYISNGQGYTTNWLLGYDNLHIVTILPAIVLSLLYSYINGEKIKFRTKLLLIIGIGSVFIRFSGTSVVAIFMLIFFILTRKSIFKNTRIFNCFNYYLFHLTLFVAIVLLRVQDIFSWIIVDILGKSLTFTGRTNIWDTTIEHIKNNYIIGYGVEKASTRVMKNLNQYATHAHNHILEVLYKGGIPLLLVFSYLLLLVGKKLIMYKDTIISKTISFSILIFLTMMLVEARDTLNLYILLILGYYVNKIVEVINSNYEGVKHG